MVVSVNYAIQGVSNFEYFTFWIPCKKYNFGYFFLTQLTFGTPGSGRLNANSETRQISLKQYKQCKPVSNSLFDIKTNSGGVVINMKTLFTSVILPNA